MRRILLFLSFVFVTSFSYSQTTYYWVGGTGAGTNVSFTLGSKWNTALNGSGTSRPVQDPTDILIIDGTNVGGATPATGAVTATCGSTSFGKLILRNGATLTIVRPSSGTGTITINGDASATDDDLQIGAGCSLTSTVADSVAATSGNNLLLAPTATGRIYGTLFLNNGACRMTASNPATGGSCFFESGAVCKVNTQITYYPFGSSSGVSNAVVFNSGSKLIYLGGNCIFTSSSTFNPVDFKTGSTFRIETSVPSAQVTSNNLFANRRFANIEVGANASVTADFFYNIDNLTIDAGSSFYLKSSGASPVSGNIINNGTFGSVAGFTSSNLLMKGTSPQSIGGSGTFMPFGAFSVATDANVTLNTNIVVNGSTNSLINGKINFQNRTLSGTGTFQTKAALPITTNVTSGAAGSYNLVLDAAAYNSTTNNAGVYNGILVTGTGVPPNTYIIGTSSSASTITLSNPLTGSPISVTLSGGIPVLRTSNVNGIDGSIGGAGVLSISNSTDFIYDGPTSQPFSNISLGSVRNVTFNAAATTNRTIWIDSVLTLNSGILTIRPTDTVRIRNAKDIAGAPFNSAKHIAIQSNATGSGALRIDLMSTAKLFPIGTATKYLPATLTPTTSSSLTASVFEGITDNGSLTGTPLNATDLLKVVNAVWRIGRVTGTGDLGVAFGWESSLEGTLFSTQANARIGVIQNSGTAWSTPFGTGDNAANTASATATSVGSFGVGSLPLMTPFTFNALAAKTYGDADYNCGVVSLNTSQPITFTSSNTAVATISASGVIHIVGTGTTVINASQASDGNYLAANESQTLVVNKAPLTVIADDKTKFEGAANPALTATYNGFVNGESASVLTAQVVLTTTATVASTAGTYPITASGATALNYNISYAAGTLTVLARQNQTITFNALNAVTYGDADFTPSVSSTNNAIPVTLVSSNPAVATIAPGNTIHITGAGTTTIIASQAGDLGHFPAADVTVDLVVNKAALIVGVQDAVKAEGEVNPAFTLTYSGFVLGETESVLSVLPDVYTTATTNSIPGVYSLQPQNGTAANYQFSYTTGRLTIYPKDSAQQSITVLQGNNQQLQVKIYSPVPDIGSFVIYDQQGRLLARKDVFVVSGFSTVTLDIKNWANAYYIVSYKGKTNTISKQILISK